MLASLLALWLAGSSAPPPAVCIVGLPLAKLAESYPLIFEGEVADEPAEIVVKTERTAEGPTLRWLGLRMRMHVHNVWAGAAPESIEVVYTHHAQDIHGRFDKGERFIVWAERRDGRWMTSDCAPTIERRHATPEMLAFLERLKKQ